MTTKAYFFQKKCNNGMTDIEKEREWRLKRIKQERKPINFRKILKHEEEYLNKKNEYQSQREERLKVARKEVEEKWKGFRKSKKYVIAEDAYLPNRFKEVHLKEEKLKYKERAIEYLKTIDHMGFPKIKKTFPKDGDDHKKWWYGRFSQREISKSLDLTNNIGAQEKRNN